MPIVTGRFNANRASAAPIPLIAFSVGLLGCVAPLL